MLLLQILLATAISFADSTAANTQEEIDKAFGLIFKTSVGRAVCRDILGSDPAMIKKHLGVSLEKAKAFSAECASAPPLDKWLEASAPLDLNKLKDEKSYVFIESFSGAERLQLESWTDHYSNTTTIFTANGKKHELNKLVQILAHEMAVYLDSKTYPDQQSAQNVSALRAARRIEAVNGIRPVIAFSNPIIATAMTYLRALQVEHRIIEELVNDKSLNFTAPPGHYSKDVLELVDENCPPERLAQFINDMKNELLPYSFALLAFASPYRQVMMGSLQAAGLNWSNEKWVAANSVLVKQPERYADTIAHQLSSSVASELAQAFSNGAVADLRYIDTAKLMAEVLAAEEPALLDSKFAGGLTLLEFMKVPLLSGKNVALSNGPRIFLITGLIE